MADKVDNMKKIKLTEADLTRIIQKIIREDDSESYTNYMFFSNLEQIKRQCEKLLSMDKNMIDNTIQNGHDWADDHISEAKNNMDQVFDFFMGKANEGSMEMDESLEEEKEMCEECWDEEESINENESKNIKATCRSIAKRQAERSGKPFPSADSSDKIVQCIKGKIWVDEVKKINAKKGKM